MTPQQANCQRDIIKSLLIEYIMYMKQNQMSYTEAHAAVYADQVVDGDYVLEAPSPGEVEVNINYTLSIDNDYMIRSGGNANLIINGGVMVALETPVSFWQRLKEGYRLFKYLKHPHVLGTLKTES